MIQTCEELMKGLGDDAKKKVARLVDPRHADRTFWYFARDWIRRAHRRPSRLEQENEFEGFIYLWVVFNGWASTILDNADKSDNDRYLIAALAVDPEFNEHFQQLQVMNADFRRNCAELAALMPIFRVRTLQKLDIPGWRNEPRNEYVRSVLHRPNGAPKNTSYAPSCFLKHEHESHEEQNVNWIGAPNDWPHTINTIYMIRCNLFHGGKSYDSEVDRILVGHAFHILWDFWKHQLPPDELSRIERSHVARVQAEPKSKDDRVLDK